MKDRGTGAWFYLVLTEQQRELIRARAGKDAVILALTLTELVSGRFFVPEETPAP